MELYKVDTQLRESTTLVRKALGKWNCSAAQIRGDILLVLSPFTLYLGNWKREQYVATIVVRAPVLIYINGLGR